MKLNKQQSSAVNHKTGPLLIIAGAGTGKTAVITQRILRILKEESAKPTEILALTFTDKAAAEMEERIDIEMPYGYEEMWISTFHSFCDRILKQEGVYIGLDPNYKMMTQAESYIFFRQHLFDFPLDIFRPLGNPTRSIGDILKHFSRLQDEDVSPDDYLAYVKGLSRKGAEGKEKFLAAKELAETYKMYTDLKVSNSKLDFGDLITTTLHLFRSRPSILKKYHKRFKHILVDEYQDTNFTQNVLVNMLVLGVEPEKASKTKREKANITVVGDDDQAIYKFRGAAISNILQFKEAYPTAKRVVLTDNYRSKQEILDSAYTLISNNNPYRLEVTESISKKLKQAKEFDKSSDAVNVVFANSASGEADRVVQDIVKLTNHGKGGEGEYGYNDIALLVRAHSHSDDFVQALRYYGVPYKFGGARGLYSRPEVLVLISFLRALVDHADEISMFNLLSMPELSLEAREVVDILKEAKRRKISTFEAIESIVGRKAGSEKGKLLKISYKPSSEAMTGLALLVDLFDKGFQMIKQKRGAGEILFMFFDKSGYKDSIVEEDTAENQLRVDNIRRYFELIREYERNNTQTTIHEYMGYLDYSLEIGQNPSVDQSMLVEYDAVNIMTVHGAKGLEFPVVFMVNLVDQRFPSRNMRDRIPIPDELVKEVVTAEDEGEEHRQEERRLFYVGATRSQEKLYFTAANFYAEGKRRKKPSIFLNEILDRDVREEMKGLGEDDVVSFPVHRASDADIVDWTALNLEPSSRFSYTQLSTFEKCPREYKYKYVLGLPTPPNSNLAFGQSVHNSLRAFYERVLAVNAGLEEIKMPNKKDLMSLYDSFWISEGYDNKNHEKRKYDFGKKRLQEYLKKFDFQKEQPIELERKFKYAIDDIKVTGVVDRIDLVAQKGKKKVVEIIDYKTGKAKTEKDANKEWQLVLYAMAVEEQLGFIVQKASYLYLDNGSKVEVMIDEKRKEQVKERVKVAVEKIRAGDFTVPSGHSCDYCDFGNIGAGAIL